MDQFTKITVGFVTQCYERKPGGTFVCMDQEFIAGDQVDYEDGCGNAITPPDHKYQPFNMALISNDEMIDQLKSVLERLDVGGEQSRQFAGEIHTLQEVLATVRKMALEFHVTLQEQSTAFAPRMVKVHLLSENGQLWIQPEGYGEKCTPNGQGSPIGLEIWQGRLRLIAFTDIHSEDPQIIDLEGARESLRKS